MAALDSYKTLRTLDAGGKTFHYYSLPEAAASLGDISRLPRSLKVLLENLLRHEDGKTRHHRRPQGGTGLARQAQLRPRDPVPPGAGADAGLHRCPRGGRPGRHARRHGQGRRRSQAHQPPVAGGSGHRPLGDGGQVRHHRRLPGKRRDRDAAQPGALRVPALGPEGLRQFPRGAAGHRHLPPGEPGVPGPDRVAQGARTARPSPIPTPWWAPTPTPP